MFVKALVILCGLIMINYHSSAEPLTSENVVECEHFFKFDLKGIYNQSLVASRRTKSNTKVQIFFKLCDEFKENEACPPGSSACLKNSHNFVVQTFGKNFEFANETSSFYMVNPIACRNAKSRNYSLIIKLIKYQDREQFVSKISKDECDYEIDLPHPQYLQKCTMYFNGKFFNLNPTFNRSFTTYGQNDSNKKFALTPCSINPICNQTDVNACEIIIDKANKTSILPLSKLSNFNLFFKNDELIFSGHISAGDTGKIIRKVELKLQCSWLKNSFHNVDRELQFVSKPIQGKLYTFKVNSSFGCIKVTPSFVLRRNHLIYNLEGIYRKHPEPWHIRNLNSDFYLQIGGPLILDENLYNKCTSTYAQVCENNGTVTNRGSIMKSLSLRNDMIRLSIENGPNPMYKTFIDFYCDKIDYGPKIFTTNVNDTYFNWKTPEACPEIDANLCISNLKRKSYSLYNHPCEFVKTSDNNMLYNLTELRTKKQRLKLNDNGTYEFIFNICGNPNNELLMKEAPCLKDASIIMKNLSEFNNKNRMASLGKFSTYTLAKNGHVTINYDTGTTRNSIQYSSEIIFICSNEERIELNNQRSGHFTFLWKTIHACPKNISNSNSSTERNLLSSTTKNDNLVNTHMINLSSVEVKSQKENNKNEPEQEEGIAVDKIIISSATVVIVLLVSSLMWYIFVKKKNSFKFFRSIHYSKCGDA